MALNLGRGDFSAPAKSWLVPAGPFTVAAADLDGDGDLDLATSSETAQTASVLLNLGGGTFAESKNFNAQGEAFRIIAIDLNGDGRPELVTANGYTNNVAVFFNETVAAASGDCNDNRIPDECEPVLPTECKGGKQLPGDCNQDGQVDISDAICLLGALFLGDPPVLPCGDGKPTHAGNLALLDWQPDGLVDLSDAVSLLVFRFLGGPKHVLAVPGQETSACIPMEGCGDNAICP